MIKQMNIIIDINDGIMALIKGHNYVVIELLFNTNQLTFDKFQEYLVKLHEGKYSYISVDFISRLIIFLDDMLFNENVIKIFMDAVIIRNCHNDKNLIASTIKKLISMGGEISSEHILWLPDDIFFERMEYNYVEINYELIQKCITYSSEKILRWCVE